MADPSTTIRIDARELPEVKAQIQKLAMLAAKAIQLNAFAVADVQKVSPTKAHMLYRKETARHMAELRERMGSEWVERECGWPDLEGPADA